MRIVIDLPSGLQAAQLATVQALLPLAAQHQLIIAVCAEHADIETSRQALATLATPPQLRIWHLPRQANATPNWCELAMAPIREHFMASLAPDVVYIPLRHYPAALPFSIGSQSAAFHSVLHLTEDADTAAQSAGDVTGLQSGWQAALPQLMQAASLCLAASDDAAASLAALPARSAVPPSTKPRLAWISPLPPEKSGIADYSAELLPYLARYYQIELVLDQDQFDPSAIALPFPQRSVRSFCQHAHEFERVLYHMGNSPMHKHMFALFQQHPGVLVLHDFFLGNVIHHLDQSGYAPGLMQRSLYESHGWSGLLRQQQQGRSDVVWHYPCNKALLDAADGVIVHSRHPMQLAQSWYGADAADNWRILPLMRSRRSDANADAVAETAPAPQGSPTTAPPPATQAKDAARAALEISPDQFLVCSFGMLGPTKLNTLLLDTWLSSPMANDPAWQLVLVGENEANEYGAELQQKLAQCSNVRLTGFVAAEQYRQWLQAADCAVQLRSQSRGETSAAVLDCLLHGLPTIVNRHGSNAELTPGVVLMLPDACQPEELRETLEVLQQDPALRERLQARAQEYMQREHAPEPVAEKYFAAIEHFAQQGKNPQYRRLLQDLSLLDSSAANETNEADRIACASAIAQNRAPVSGRQCMIDISAMVQTDLKTGIQRVVRSILMALIKNAPPGYRIEPVFTRGDGAPYHYARQYMAQQLGLSQFALPDSPVEFQDGDIFLGLDLLLTYVQQNRQRLQAMRDQGVRVFFVVYDILPLLRPNCFPPGSEAAFLGWIDTASRVADGLLCISQAVAGEVRGWLDAHAVPRQRPLSIGWFHLGADIDASAPSRGLPENAETVLHSLRARPSILMVGTLEPRKGHAQTLAAFELLWQQGVNLNLVIVGKHGWLVDALAERLKNHPENGQRLFWLAGISDEMLLNVYQASKALLAASEGEGFGLPLIEAAQHQLPIIARQLPVFEEVAGQHAFWFNGLTAQELADALKAWLALFHAGQAPDSRAMPWLNWEQSAQQLKNLIWDGQWQLQYPAPTCATGNTDHNANE